MSVPLVPFALFDRLDDSVANLVTQYLRDADNVRFLQTHRRAKEIVQAAPRAAHVYLTDGRNTLYRLHRDLHLHALPVETTQRILEMNQHALRKLVLYHHPVTSTTPPLLGLRYLATNTFGLVARAP